MVITTDRRISGNAASQPRSGPSGFGQDATTEPPVVAGTGYVLTGWKAAIDGWEQTDRHSLMVYALRLLATVVAAAFMASTTGGLLLVAYDYLTGPSAFGLQAAAGGWLFMSAMAFPFTLAGLIVVGLPVDWVLARRRWNILPVYALAGAISGLLSGLLFLDLGASISAIFGVLAAVGWWVVSNATLRTYRPFARTT